MLRKAKNRTKRSNGNMLAMVSLVILVVVAVLGTGILISMMMMSQKRTQNKLETLSLSMANQINKEDWVGQMNNMTELARELVFTSRSALNETVAHHARMRPLALQLMEEARQSATLVAEERRELIVIILKDLQKATDAAGESEGKGNGMSLPGVKADAPEIRKVDAGYIEGVLSNLTAPEGLPDLREYDLQEKYVTPNSFVYFPNINAKLPAPDDDINFEICSLAAAAKNTLAPARLTANSVFRKLMTVGPEAGNDFSKCKQLPSAVQVVSATKVSSGENLQGSMGVTISAASGGATLTLP